MATAGNTRPTSGTNKEGRNEITMGMKILMRIFLRYSFIIRDRKSWHHNQIIYTRSHLLELPCLKYDEHQSFDICRRIPMSILAWIEEQRQLKIKQSITPLSLSDGGRGLWTRCDCCGVILYIKLLKQDLYVCSGCGHHILMSCTERIHSLIDTGTWNPTHEFISPCDPLVFEDERLYQVDGYRNRR